MGLPPGEELFGIYKGESLTERSITCPSLYPESITVFKEPLENACDTPEELAEEIDITIVHEVAHFLRRSQKELNHKMAVRLCQPKQRTRYECELKYADDTVKRFRKHL